jgi:hypothetical protein
MVDTGDLKARLNKARQSRVLQKNLPQTGAKKIAANTKRLQPLGCRAPVL